MSRTRAWHPAPALLIAALASVTLSGCLISESDELRVELAPDGKSGRLTLTQVNLQSDDTTAAGRGEDWDTALRNWTGDQALVEAVEEGYYIKSRRLWVEDGKLMWEQVALFAPPPKDFLEAGPAGRYRVRLQKGEELVSSNGTRTTLRDTVFVTWPRGTREFRVEIRHRDFRPTTSFSDSFAAHLARHPEDRARARADASGDRHSRHE